MAKQVALTIPKPVLEFLRPGTNLPRQWEIVFLAMEAAKQINRTDLADALAHWLSRMDELNKLKNELIKHERTKSYQNSDAGDACSASRGAESA